MVWFRNNFNFKCSKQVQWWLVIIYFIFLCSFLFAFKMRNFKPNICFLLVKLEKFLKSVEFLQEGNAIFCSTLIIPAQIRIAVTAGDQNCMDLGF